METPGKPSVKRMVEPQQLIRKLHAPFHELPEFNTLNGMVTLVQKGDLLEQLKRY